MRRREFIVGITGAATAWPLAVLAQQPRMPVIGLLGAAIANDWARYISAFRHGLRDAGYVEGDRTPLGQQSVRAIAGHGSGTRSAAGDGDCCSLNACGTGGKSGDDNDPYCFHNEPRSSADWSRRQPKPPGWHITGATNLGVEVEPKLLELLHDAVPSAKIIALLVNPTNFSTDI